MIRVRPSFRWILQYPDISRHLENRLRQTGCSGVFGMIKLNFTENSIKRKIGIFRRKNTMCNKNLKTLSSMVLATGALLGLAGAAVCHPNQSGQKKKQLPLPLMILQQNAKEGRNHHVRDCVFSGSVKRNKDSESSEFWNH